MTKKKASMSQVLTDIKPYITKKFMAAPCVKEQDIQAICQILLLRCKNVQLMQGLTNNKPDFRIQVVIRKDQQPRRNLTWAGLNGWKKCMRTAMIVLPLSLDTQMAVHRSV